MLKQEARCALFDFVLVAFRALVPVFWLVFLAGAAASLYRSFRFRRCGLLAAGFAAGNHLTGAAFALAVSVALFSAFSAALRSGFLRRYGFSAAGSAAGRNQCATGIEPGWSAGDFSRRSRDMEVVD